MADEILHEGKFLRFLRRDGWEFAQRRNASAVVAIVAVTRERELVLVEQFRPPLARNVLELPAGLVGDEHCTEALLDAAAREHECQDLVADAGGGVGDEAIQTHVIALDDATRWLDERRGAGALIDAKIYAALWFAARAAS